MSQDIELEKINKVKKLAKALGLDNVVRDLENFRAALKGLESVLNGESVEFEGSFVLKIKDGVIKIRAFIPLANALEVEISEGMTEEDIRRIRGEVQSKLIQYILSISDDLIDGLSRIAEDGD